MSDYIPTTDDVEGFYNQGVSEFGPVTSDPDYHDFDGKFRLWLAEHDRRTAEKAWDEAVDWLSRHWLDRAERGAVMLFHSDYSTLLEHYRRLAERKPAWQTGPSEAENEAYKRGYREGYADGQQAKEGQA